MSARPETHPAAGFSDMDFQDSVPGYARPSKNRSAKGASPLPEKRSFLRHSDAVNAIHLAVSDMGGITVPYTVGMFRQVDPPHRLVKVGRPGVADILACIDGRFVAIEVKVGRDTQRQTQKPFQRAVEANGGIYVLARFTATEDGVETLRRAVG
jgi:hypothetical protein